MKKLSILALALASTTVLTEVGIAIAQSPGTPIEQRQAAMKMNGAALKTMTPIARGEQPWNQATVIAGLDTLSKNAAAIPGMFPQGSGAASGVKTAALPAIWERWAEFQAAAKTLQDSADNLTRMARANDEAGFKTNYASLGRACGGCHEPFRAKQ